MSWLRTEKQDCSFVPEIPRSLADALLKLITNRELARTMGAAAREHVMKNFQLKETIHKTVHLYQKLLAEKLKDA